MKNLKFIIVILALSMAFTGCSVFQGRTQKDNVNQVRGSNIWMNQRLNKEQDAQQLNSQFGDQEGDANDERPQGMDTDRSFPGFNK